MAELFTVKRIYDELRRYERRRHDIGVVKTVFDGMLEPASPFESQAVRSPKRWFVLLSLLDVSAVGCFVYFNKLW